MDIIARPLVTICGGRDADGSTTTPSFGVFGKGRCFSLSRHSGRPRPRTVAALTFANVVGRHIAAPFIPISTGHQEATAV